MIIIFDINWYLNKISLLEYTVTIYKKLNLLKAYASCYSQKVKKTTLFSAKINYFIKNLSSTFFEITTSKF